MRKPGVTNIRSQHETLRTGRAVGVPGAFGGYRHRNYIPRQTRVPYVYLPGYFLALDVAG